MRAREIERLAFHLNCTKDFLLCKSDHPYKNMDGAIEPFTIDPDFIEKGMLEDAIKEFPEAFQLLCEASFKLPVTEKHILIKIMKALLDKN